MTVPFFFSFRYIEIQTVQDGQPKLIQWVDDYPQGPIDHDGPNTGTIFNGPTLVPIMN